MSKRYITYVVVYQEDEETPRIGLSSELAGGIVTGMATGDEMLRSEKLTEALIEHDPRNPALDL